MKKSWQPTKMTPLIFDKEYENGIGYLFIDQKFTKRITVEMFGGGKIEFINIEGGMFLPMLKLRKVYKKGTTAKKIFILT